MAGPGQVLLGFTAATAPHGHPMAWDSIVPSWAREEAITSLAVALRNHGDPRPVPMQCCVGPAVRLSFYASLLTWGLFSVLPWPILLASECRGVSAHYDAAVVWFCVSPAIVTLLTIEWTCLKYYIIPVIQVTGGFKIMSQPVKFVSWLLFSFAVSLSSHMDLITNGIFLATTWTAMTACSAKVELACIWFRTMQDGVFGYIPYYQSIHPKFEDLVGLLWFGMLGQAFYSWLGSWPLSKMHKALTRCGLRCLYASLERRKGWATRGVTSELRFDPGMDCYCTFTELTNTAAGRFNAREIEDYWENSDGNGCQVTLLPVYEVSTLQETQDFLDGALGLKTMFQTYLDDGPDSWSGHGAALFALADSCRMVSITTMRVSYATQKVSTCLRHPNPDMRDNGAAFGLMKQVAQACGHKLVLAGIMQTGLQLNLQVTLLGMTTLMTKAQADANLGKPIGFVSGITSYAVDRQMVFSITVGLINVLKNAFDIWMAISWLGAVLATPAHASGGLAGRPGFRRTLESKVFRLKMLLGVYAVVIIYTIAKLWAVFECPFSMFNITGCARRFEECLLLDASMANASAHTWY